MQVFESSVHGAIIRIALSSDGRYVLVSDDSLMPEVWDRITGIQVELPGARDYGQGELHPDGGYCLIRRHHILRFFDLTTRRATSVTNNWPNGIFRFAGAARLIGWGMGRERQYVFAGCRLTAGWDCVPEWEVPADRRPLNARALHLTPSGDYFAVQVPLPNAWESSGGEVLMLSASSGSVISRSTLKRGLELRGILNPQVLLVSDRDRLVAWDTTAGEAGAVCLPGRLGKDTIHVAVSADGRRMVAARRQTVFELDAQTFEIRRALSFPINALIHSVAYSPDGLTAAFGTGRRQFVIWDLE